MKQVNLHWCSPDARMLYCLVVGRARTSTELAVVARLTSATASVHLQRLKTQRLVQALAQGKHRYYSLDGVPVADVLEALSAFTGGSRDVVPNTPSRLRPLALATITLREPRGVSLPRPVHRAALVEGRIALR